MYYVSKSVKLNTCILKCSSLIFMVPYIPDCKAYLDYRGQILGQIFYVLTQILQYLWSRMVEQHEKS
jgi:hypothetical protein